MLIEKFPLASAFPDWSLTNTSALGVVFPLTVTLVEPSVSPFLGEVTIREILSEVTTPGLWVGSEEEAGEAVCTDGVKLVPLPEYPFGNKKVNQN